MDDELEQVSTLIAGLLQRSVITPDSTDLVSWLTVVHVLVTQLTGLQAGLVRELSGRGVPVGDGATSTRTWLRDRLRVSIHTAKRLCDLGVQMDARARIRDAVVNGAVSADQAAVIAAALADLPGDLDSELVDRCEAVLIGQAAVFEPHTLGVLGQRVLDHVAPELADAALQAKLERDEQRAARTRTFTMTPDGTGRTRLSGWVDTEGAAVIRTAIDPLCKPLPGPDGGRDPRPVGQRRADALVDVCRLALATDTLPDNGGLRPQLHVIVEFDILNRLLGVGILDTGETLSPAAVRQLACDAAIIPAVLGGRGEVLDLGRARRLFVGAVRRALILRDRGCAFPGCDRPPWWCDAHHVTSWLDGGTTNLDNGVLLCRYHHTLIHHSAWTIQLDQHRRPQFIPPPHIDPQQRPLCNTYHRRH